MSFEADPIAVLARDELHARLSDLIAEACAWSVGMSDRPHYQRRHGRVTATGITIGARAAGGQLLSGEEDRPLDLGEVRPGTFRDALGALTADGRVYGELLEQQVVRPFVLDTCVAALETAARTHPGELADVLDDLGEHDSDPTEVVRAGDWEAALRIDAEHLVVAALGDQQLTDVEAEGLPLSLVRAAESLTRGAAPTMAEDDPSSGREELAGALFLAEAALRAADLAEPVTVAQAPALVEVLRGEGLEDDEILAMLERLPVTPDAAEAVVGLLDSAQD